MKDAVVIRFDEETGIVELDLLLPEMPLCELTAALFAAALGNGVKAEGILEAVSRGKAVERVWTSR